MEKRTFFYSLMAMSLSSLCFSTSSCGDDDDDESKKQLLPSTVLPANKISFNGQSYDTQSEVSVNASTDNYQMASGIVFSSDPESEPLLSIRIDAYTVNEEIDLTETDANYEYSLMLDLPNRSLHISIMDNNFSAHDGDNELKESPFSAGSLKLVYLKEKPYEVILNAILKSGETVQAHLEIPYNEISMW